MITKESLCIYWKFEEGFQEVDGLYFYGLWKDYLPKNLKLEDIDNLWKTGTIDLKICRFEAEEYKVLGINLYIKNFPQSTYWLKNIRNILVWLIDCGAYISWCGTEDCSPNPEIFDLKLSYGNIYACFTKKTDFLCNSDLQEEIKYLNDSQLTLIKTQMLRI